MADAATRIVTEDEVDKYCALFKEAAGKAPKSAQVVCFKEYAEARPTLFDGFSMLANVALQAVIEASSDDAASRIHNDGEARSLQRSLGYKTATPIEKLLIKNIVLCWVRLQTMEDIYTSGHSTGISFAMADYLERRLSATQRRYLRSVESLARVRGLMARAGVQVNIAQNQVVQNS